MKTLVGEPEKVPGLDQYSQSLSQIVQLFMTQYQFDYLQITSTRDNKNWHHTFDTTIPKGNN